MSKEIKTQEELAKILQKLYKNTSSDNIYGNIIKGNKWSNTGASSGIKYNYKHKDQKYELLIENGVLIKTTDNDLLKILNKEINNYKNYYFNLTKDFNELYKEEMLEVYKS